MVVGADVTPVFSNNSSERSEVTCTCCDKFRTELQKTLTELKSAQKLLNCYGEEINLHTPNRTVRYRRTLLASQREFYTFGTH
jgi:hypothetical protein